MTSLFGVPMSPPRPFPVGMGVEAVSAYYDALDRDFELGVESGHLEREERDAKSSYIGWKTPEGREWVREVRELGWCSPVQGYLREMLPWMALNSGVSVVPNSEGRGE